MNAAKIQATADRFDAELDRTAVLVVDDRRAAVHRYTLHKIGCEVVLQAAGVNGLRALSPAFPRPTSRATLAAERGRKHVADLGWYLDHARDCGHVVVHCACCRG